MPRLLRPWPSPHLQRGVALVEFALVLPFLLMLTMLATEFGRAVYEYNTVAKSVRDAARYLSTVTPGTGAAQARNLIVYGNFTGSGSPLAPDLVATSARVPDPTWSTQGSAPTINTVTVRVTGYTFRPLFVTAFGQTWGPFTFPDITATMRSYL